MNKNVSNLCDNCKVPADTSHFLFTCKAYVDQRNSLEATVDDIIHREGLDSIGDINFKVLNGAIEKKADRAKMICWVHFCYTSSARIELNKIN